MHRPFPGSAQSRFLAGMRGSWAPATIEAVVRDTYSPVAVADAIRRCSGSPAVFLIAELEASVVGFLDFDSEGPEPELHRLYVDPEVTARGIGGALLRCLHERLGSAASYILLVLAANERAVRFYER